MIKNEEGMFHVNGASLRLFSHVWYNVWILLPFAAYLCIKVNRVIPFRIIKTLYNAILKID